MNSTGWGSKKKKREILLFSCRVESPATVKDRRRRRRPVLGAGRQQMNNTCPCHMYITLMLTCKLSAVAAWRHGLCVCTDVATCEFVQYMQVCVCVPVSANKSVCRHANSNTCMHPLTTAHTDTLQQLFPTLHIVLSSAHHSAWRLCSVSFLF